MRSRSLMRSLRPTVGGLAALSGPLCFTAAAQVPVVFSIDYRGPTIAVPAAFGGPPITEGDLLTPATAGPGALGPTALAAPVPPAILITAGPLGLGLPMYPGCVGHPPGIPCAVEVDALSFGTDPILPAGIPTPQGYYIFSVDKFARGIAGTALPPAVWTESGGGGGALATDACADGFVSLALPGAPVPLGPIGGNTGMIDGNGLVSATGFVYPGLGIFEPNLPLPVGPTPGDELDALDVNPPFPPLGGIGVLFSLDAAFVDPLTGVPNTGSAAANGFLPGMVLQTLAAGGPPLVWAIPPMLGLDLAGPATDDLDALAVRENGVPGYQPGLDLVLFSVRRGSAVIGMPDSILGIPIEPGDILVPPPAGGIATPGIWVPAERLGLLTKRTHGVAFGDDLDALDVGASTTAANIPAFCFGDGTGVTPCPCGNTGLPGRGCDNSFATGGAQLSAAGTTTPDTMVLTQTGELLTAFSIFLQGTTALNPAVTFGDGLRCVGGSLKRLYLKAAVAGTVSAPTGADPAITVRSAALGDPIPVGGVRFYQVYYRDPSPTFCPNPPGNTWNVGNAWAIVWL